jgi:arylsulfatase A-like enzyme
MRRPTAAREPARSALCARIALALGAPLFAAVAALAALAALAAPAAHAAPPRPNFVVIVVDDWGFTDVGAFGGEIPTPHLDALAARGTRFTNFHVAASCAPTRAMLLTGVEHHLAGVGNLIESMPRAHRGRPGYLGSLAPDVVTVSSMLQAAGWRTYASGKWNVGTEPHNLPDRRGFDRSIVQGDTGSDNWVPTQRYLPHSGSVQWFEDGRPARMPATFYSSEWFVDRLVGFLRDAPDREKPFFALLGFQANHVPLQAPREFVERHAGRYEDGWDALRRARRDRAAALGVVPPGTALAAVPTTPDWNALSAEERRYQAKRMQVYAAMAEAMDHHLGRLVEFLRTEGRLDDTVFVFLSDNGPEGSDYRAAQPWLWTQYTQSIDRLGGPGAYAIMGPGWASAAASPLSGYKFVGGEGGTRVPLIVAGAPGTRAGGLHHGLAHVTDIVPTLLELAGLPAPGATVVGRTVKTPTGRSLVPALRDPDARVRGPDDAIGYELSGDEALYRGDLKLSRGLPPLGDGRWRLFDLAADPGETRDLASERPELVARLAAEYDAWAREHGVLPMPPGYDAARQVAINSVLDYWLPAYAPVGGAVALAIATALVLRRRRRAAPPAGAAP